MKSKQEFHKMIKEKARENYFKLSKHFRAFMMFGEYEVAFSAGFESGLEFIQEEFNK